MTPKFHLGQIVATPGALETLAESGQDAEFFLQKHLSGDGGEPDAEGEEPGGGVASGGVEPDEGPQLSGRVPAAAAVASGRARIIYNLMRYGAAYVKREEAAYAEQVRERQEKQLHRRAKELGFEVTRIAPPEGVPVPEVALPSSSA